MKKTLTLIILLLFFGAFTTEAAVTAIDGVDDFSTTLETQENNFLEPTPSASELFERGELGDKPIAFDEQGVGVVGGGSADGIKGVLSVLKRIVTMIVPYIIALAILFFLWGVFKYFFLKGDEGRASGRSFMLWGIIALVVMVSVWGLLAILLNVFGLSAGPGDVANREFIDTSAREAPAISLDISSVGSGESPLVQLIMQVTAILNLVTPLIIGLAILFFIWGIFKYVFVKGEQGQSEAKSIMVYGLIALTVMLSVWGLVNLIAVTFDFELGGDIREERYNSSSLYDRYLRP